MSVEAQKWAWEQTGLSPTEKLVLIYLSDKSGDNGVSWHGRARIAKYCGLENYRSVTNVIARLEKKGFVRRYKRFTEQHSQTSNFVVVLFDGRIEDEQDIIRGSETYLQVAPINQDKGGSSINDGGGHRSVKGGVIAQCRGGSLCDDPKPKIEITTTTTTTRTSETDTDFQAFLLSLLVVMDEMIDSGGYLPAGTPTPRNAFTRAKAEKFYKRYGERADIAECSHMILRDWVSLIAKDKSKTGKVTVASYDVRERVTA